MRYLLALLAFGLLFVGCAETPSDPALELKDPEMLSRGRQLVNGLAACGFCHGEKREPGAPLSGGLIYNDKFGEVIAPNLTPSKSGLSGWTIPQIIRVFRGNRGREEEYLSLEAHAGLEWISDDDAMAIIAYLSSLPPVENEVSRRTLGTLTRNTTGILDSWKEVRGYVPSLNQRFGVEYGKYLLENVARCQSCHNTPGTLMTEGEYLMGGSTMRHERGEKRVPGISSSPEEGLGAWAEEDIVRYLQTGGTPENNYSDASFCPVGFYRNSDPKDLMAIAKYLKTVR